MFTLFEPSAAAIAGFIERQKNLPFSYSEVGASKNALPAGYPINHHRRKLGNGAEIFARAKKAVAAWTMYQLDWTRVCPQNVPIAAGEVVCIVVDHGFCWSLNPCRIIYTANEKTADRERCGFAFGTLPGHSETGEERFTVEWNRADDAVYYELTAFARQQHLLAQIGFPLVGIFQRKFAADSADAMLKAVSSGQFG